MPSTCLPCKPRHSALLLLLLLWVAVVGLLQSGLLPCVPAVLVLLGWVVL